MSPPLDGQLEVAALSGELQAVMEGIVARLMEFDGADGASLSTIDDEYAYFKVCAGADKELEGQTMPLAATLGNECVQRGGVTVLRATTGPEVARCLTPGAGAIILAPIEYDGAFQGVLGVRSADPDAFDEQEAETLRLLTRGASIALRNAELVERLAGSERRYRELHEHAADAMLVSDDEGNLIDANDTAAVLLGYSVLELRAMSVSDLIDGDNLEREPLHRAELLAQGELRGERPYRRKDGALVEVEYSARVLDDGRVHTTLRDIGQRKRDEHRLRTTLARMHAIVQIQQEISTLELDADAVTKAIVERAQELTGADGATVQWFEGNDSVFLHTAGIAAPHAGHRLGREVGLASLAASSRTTLYVPDTLTDDRVDKTTALRVGARSLICAPLYRDGAVAGVLSIVGSKPGAFDELDVETTRMMAEFVSSVIRNSNELEERRRLVENLRTQGDVVHHMQTGLWIWVRDGDTHRLEYANAAGAAAIGRTAAEIVGQTLEDGLPGAAEATLALVNRVADTGERIDTAEIEYSDERVQPSVFSVKAFPLPNDRVAISFESVTEKAHAQRALQESEARFRGAFYSSSLGMALETLDGKFIQVNDRLVEMLGYTIDELTSLGVRGITHADDVEGDLELGARLRDGEIDSYHREKRYLRKDGSVLWAELTVSLVAGYGGQPSNVLSHVQDITAQKQASLLFEASFERSVVPQFFANDNRQLVDINKAGTDLLGVTHDEALRSTVDQLLADEPVAELWPVFMKAGALDAEVSLHRPDGSTRRVEFAATANIRPGRHLAVVRDLTLQKELEVQLRQAQKMEAVGRLAGGIAHDFN
ncbi:MAG TPA: PAS domain S-box protein, partial [Gaiellaceae bacterium]